MTCIAFDKIEIETEKSETLDKSNLEEFSTQDTTLQCCQMKG